MRTPHCTFPARTVVRPAGRARWPRILTGLISVCLIATSAATVLAQGNAGSAVDHDGVPIIPSHSMVQIMRHGGVMMWPILCCSFVLLAFVFERLIALRRGRVIPGPFVKRFLHKLEEGQLDKQSAIELCQENGSAVANVFAAAIRKWGRPAEEIERTVLDAGERAVNELRKHIRVFNGIATVSPLLGLLGTVVGIIRSFNSIAVSDAIGRSELLAHGVSEALLTTASGLIVAIPSLCFYFYFLGRVDRLTIDIDALGQEVVEIVCEGGPANAAPTRQRVRRQETAA